MTGTSGASTPGVSSRYVENKLAIDDTEACLACTRGCTPVGFSGRCDDSGAYFSGGFVYSQAVASAVRRRRHSAMQGRATHSEQQGASSGQQVAGGAGRRGGRATILRKLAVEGVCCYYFISYY